MSNSPLAYESKLKNRHFISHMFSWVCFLSTWAGILVLLVLISALVWKGWDFFKWTLIYNMNSRIDVENAGIFAGLLGSLWLIFFAGAFAVPIGVGAAIYLEEFTTDNWWTRIVRTNISNLAGVPSIVYGLLGYTIFVKAFFMFDIRDPLIREIPLYFFTIVIKIPFGQCVLSGGLTLGILVLPIIIIASQEALRSVPQSIRHGAYALGSTRWQAIRYQVLPAAIPGIMTGTILAMSRAIGETAPIIAIGASTFLLKVPGDIDSFGQLFSGVQALMEVPYSEFTAMPLEIYNWSIDPDEKYRSVAAAAIVVLLGMLLIMNGLAIYIRNRFEKNLKW